MNLSIKSLLSASLFALAVPVAIAHAETKSTVVVMHRNIGNVQDESNWTRLSANLAQDGYRVVSVAIPQTESASTVTTNLLSLLRQTGDRNVVLVGTSAVSESVDTVAQAMHSAVRAVVYVSAGDQVPAFGPRNVVVPANLHSLSSYQVKVTTGKHLDSRREANSTTYLVREQGTSTLARIDDLQMVIESVSHMNHATV